MRKETIKFEGRWRDAFGEPERSGVWFVWGGSGNGKTSFVMQLCKELARHGSVVYDSLEEGACLTMQNTLRRYDMGAAGRRFHLLDGEDMEALKERAGKRKSPDFYVIDSFQYTMMGDADYIRLKESCRNKLLIFVSHADGSKPAGRPAARVMFDATLKIYVEGFRAFSKGRFIGPLGYYTVWDEGAGKHWGGKDGGSDN